MTEQTLGAKVVAVAKSHIGEGEVPLGSNSGPFVQKCQAATFLGGTNWPWCAAFFCLCNEEAGVPVPYASAGAYDLLKWAQDNGHSPKIPEPGDGVVFNIGEGHIGICERVEGASIVTIDGNWDDHVERHTTSRSLVAGYVRNPGHLPPPPLPRWVVATSIHGHKKILFRADTKKRLLKWILHHGGIARGVTIKRSKKKHGKN